MLFLTDFPCVHNSSVYLGGFLDGKARCQLEGFFLSCGCCYFGVAIIFDLPNNKSFISFFSMNFDLPKNKIDIFDLQHDRSNF